MSRNLARFGLALLAAVAASAVAAGQASIPGLDIKVTKIERAASASLKDCPPGTNTVNAVAKPGDQFALVTIAFKVGSSFTPAALKGKPPTALDTAHRKYFTPSYCVDPGSVTEFSC